MKTIYRGYEIDVYRERCMGGWSMLYFSIFRVSDGRECLASFTEGSDTVSEYVGYMKERIDSELESDDPWGEKSGQTESV